MKRTAIAFAATPLLGLIIGQALGRIMHPDPHPAFIPLWSYAGGLGLFAYPAVYLISAFGFSVLFGKAGDIASERDKTRAIVSLVIGFIVTLFLIFLLMLMGSRSA